MRVVIQRVTQASVAIEEKIKGTIKRGFVIFIGIDQKDNIEDIEWLTNKIVSLRIFGDENRKMNLSIKDIDGDILLISQFTLHASTKKGNRPSFIHAANPEFATAIYHEFIKHLETDLGKGIITGEFGAEMDVQLTNDGPVTIAIDTKNKE